ncbi:MAG: Maf family protein [Alphaproteobacteria bacterium]|nr:Maf family protein [Alphaproteobacteria bacterium]
MPLILASSSPQRHLLLKQIGITPDQIIDPQINEIQFKGEKPKTYVQRLALSKASKINQKFSDHYILAADTIVVVRNQKILTKPSSKEEALYYLNLLSGKRHKVYGGIALITPWQKSIVKVVTTKVQFKKLSPSEITTYLQCNEWKDKAGGYAIQGRAALYISWIEGSYSNIVGLPLSETYNLLKNHGYIFTP